VADFLLGGTWAFFEPASAFVALYTSLLAAMVAMAIGRAGLLSWRLFRGVRRRIPIDRVLDGSVSADALARAALANRVSREATSHERLAASRVDLDAALRTLRAADARFDYLWRRLASGVSSTRSLMRLTLIAAGLTTTYAFYPTWLYFHHDTANDPFISGVEALYRAGAWIVVRLLLGLAVAGVLCVVATVFERRLQHRLASWKYLCATASDALSGGRPLQ